MLGSLGMSIAASSIAMSNPRRGYNYLPENEEEDKEKKPKKRKDPFFKRLFPLFKKAKKKN